MTTLAANKPMKIQLIDHKLIVPSADNPRRSCDERRLQELAASIREHGILEPLLVRPAQKKQRFEIISGERRWRAAAIARLRALPCVVMSADDERAFQMRIIENLQREDVHPLDEAQAFAEMMTRFGREAGEIAAGIGRSTGYVWRRRQLVELPERAQQALRDGSLHLSVAELLVTVAPELRDEALGDLMMPHVTTLSAARRIIEARYRTQLKGAPFDVRDAQLYPEAGSCARCPRKSGNAPLLFEDEEQPKNICLNPACFAEKVRRATGRALERARAEGVQVIEDEKTLRQIFPYTGSSVSTACAFVDADATCPDDIERTWRQVIGDRLPLYAAVDPAGRAHFLYKRREARRAVEELLPPRPDPAVNFQDDDAADAAAEPSPSELRAEAAQRLVGCIAQRALENGIQKDWWRAMCRLALKDFFSGNLQALAARYDLKPGDAAEAETMLSDLLETMTVAQLQAFLLVLIVASSFERYRYQAGRLEDIEAEARDLFGFDLKTICEQVTKERTASARAARKTAEAAR
jgi:ParB/RepB/Spo0J family partition protein